MTPPDTAANRGEAVEIIKPTPAEWDAFVRQQLDRLGISLDELRRQAQERDFQSTDARNVWVMIGDAHS
jgi:hypothetical protein